MYFKVPSSYSAFNWNFLCLNLVLKPVLIVFSSNPFFLNEKIFLNIFQLNDRHCSWKIGE